MNTINPRLSLLNVFGVFGVSLVVGCSLLTTAAAQTESAQKVNSAEHELLERRVKSAQNIIADVEALKLRAASLHKQADEQIAQANMLKGEAEILQTKTPVLPNTLHLSGAQLAAAKSQYQAEINDFVGHAQAYNNHLRQFQQLAGECHANDTSLNNIIHKYELHLEQFHTPAIAARIRPPHICGVLEGVYGGDTQHIANSIMYDELRVINAEAQLRTAENNLQVVDASAPAIQNKAMNRAVRDQQEQQLLAEFGKLREEYDLLKLEKDTLAGSQSASSNVTTSSVSGKIRK